MKSLRVLYWIVTGLFCLLMLASAGMYIFLHPQIEEIFKHLLYPAYIIYPLAMAKILGVAAIITKKSKTLKEWAYAGFFFDILLAFSAHLNVGDGVGEWMVPVFAMVLLLASYALDRKIYG